MFKNWDTSFNFITVVIDLFTTMVHLILSCTSYTTKEVAELVFEHIYKHHGMPRAIISNCNSLFMSLLWLHLHRLIESQLKMSSTYHPEADRAIEPVNHTIVQMLQQYIGNKQKDWIAKLPAIEFVINLSQSESTSYASFFLNSGGIPRFMVWNTTPKTKYPRVHVFVQRLKSALMAAHDSILAAKIKQTHTPNI